MKSAHAQKFYYDTSLRSQGLEEEISFGFLVHQQANLAYDGKGAGLWTKSIANHQL